MIIAWIFSDGNGNTVTCHMHNLATTIGVHSKGGGAAQKKENGSEKEHPAPAFQSGGWQRHSSTAF